VRAVAVSGSPSPSSRSALLLDHARSCLEEHGVEVTTLVLADLPADQLLGRATGPALEAAHAAIANASIVVASTPVYRATYSGLLKVFLDLLPRDSLATSVALPMATGAVAEHGTTLDDMRRLFESLGATVPAKGVYGIDRDFVDGRPPVMTLRRVEQLTREALDLAGRFAPDLPVTTGDL